MRNELRWSDGWEDEVRDDWLGFEVLWVDGMQDVGRHNGGRCRAWSRYHRERFQSQPYAVILVVWHSSGAGYLVRDFGR